MSVRRSDVTNSYSKIVLEIMNNNFVKCFNCGNHQASEQAYALISTDILGSNLSPLCSECYHKYYYLQPSAEYIKDTNKRDIPRGIVITKWKDALKNESERNEKRKS